MVQEIIELVIRERGATAASTSIKGIGSSSLTAARAVKGLVVALGTIAAVRGFVNLAKESIEASAALEGYRVRLTALLGDQQRANKALDEFVSISSKTPFAVSDIIEGSTALAVAAGQNEEKLLALTKTAANLAAVTGLSFQEASSNLARALQAGIGAADLFRDRGVRGLIESIQGIPDATKLSAQELEEAFESVFGATGRFGTAAEDLSKTLGGSLSNIGDAANNFKVALGDAFSPAVINVANGVLIPFFEKLQTLVKDNEDTIRTFVAGALTVLIKGFSIAANAGLGLADKLAQARQFVINLTGSFFDFQLGVAEFDASLNRLANSIGLVSDADLAFQEAEVEQLRAGVDAVAEDVFRGQQSTDAFRQSLAELSAELERLGTTAANTNLSAPVATAAAAQAPAAVNAGGPGPTAEELEKRAAAAAKLAAATKEAAEAAARDAERQRAGASSELLAINRELRLEQLGRLEGNQREIALLDEQIARAVELQRISGEEAFGQETINALIAERARLVQESAAGESIGTELASSVEAGFAQGISQGIAGTGQEFESVTRSFEDAALRGLGGGIEAAMQGFQRQLGDVIATGASSIADKFGVSLGGAAGALGQGLSQVIGLVAQQGLAALFGGGGGSQSSSSSGVRSAVTSTQAVRGIVAGPSQIAIAQVGNSITDGFQPVVVLLGEIRDGVTRIVSRAEQAATGRPGANSDALTLATQSAPLAVS